MWAKTSQHLNRRVKYYGCWTTELSKKKLGSAMTMVLLICESKALRPLWVKPMNDE